MRRRVEDKREVGSAGSKDDARHLLFVRKRRQLQAATTCHPTGAHRPPADTTLTRHTRHELAHALYGECAS